MDSLQEQKFVQSIYDSIFSSLTDAAPGQPPINASASTTFLTLQKPSRRLSGGDYFNPWSPGNLKGDKQSAANIAELADIAPQVEAIQQPTGNRISEVYRQILNAKIVPPPNDPAAEKAYQAAYNVLHREVKVTDEDTGEVSTKELDTTAFKDYKTNKSAYDLARLTFMQAYIKAQSTPEGRESWPLIGPSLMGPVNDAFDALIAGEATKVEDALATLDFSSNNQVGRAFEDAKRVFKSYEETLEVNNVVLRSRLLPTDWADANSAASWPTLTFSSGDRLEQSTSDYTSYGGNAGFSLGLFSIGGSAGHSEDQKHIHVEANSLSISYKYQLVTIDRPWLNQTIIKLPGWSMGAIAPGTYSNGQKSRQSASLMPLIPQAFIVVRDVTIKADWSKSDLDIINKATSGGGGFSFGPFSLGGSYSSKSGSKTYHPQFANGAIVQPGLQIIGWISTVLPFCPPKP